MEFSILVLGGFELERAGRTRRACLGNLGAGLKFTARRQSAFDPEARHLLAVGKKTKCHVAQEAGVPDREPRRKTPSASGAKNKPREFPPWGKMAKDSPTGEATLGELRAAMSGG